VELVNPGPNYYTDAGLNVSTQDTCILQLDPGGSIRCTISLSEFGQGTDAAVGQVVAAGLGVPLDTVDVTCGDGWSTPSGGGSWASRGIMMGSEVGWRAARTMRDNILRVAGQVLQSKPDSMDIRDGQICDSAGNARMSITEIADIMHYRQGSLPADCWPEVTAVSHYTPRDKRYVSSAGIHASYVEVDVETGFVRLLRHGVAHDCGTIINPLLLAEQLRGGAVQGMGSALYEECLYDEDGQLQNGTLAEYLVPMASEIPDIDIFNVSVPWQPGTTPKPKGVGEAGAAGASGAVLNAINDAISPIGASIAQIPCTPERLLNAIESSMKDSSKENSDQA
jgi:carbon-monoxide dehydrogenase large subunit